MIATRAATSSIARGSPSRRAQIAATLGALASARAKAVCRSTDRVAGMSSGASRRNTADSGSPSTSSMTR